MLEDVKKDAVDRMSKCVLALRNELKRLRTGRAHPSLLDHIRVDYYGTETPLNQVANIALEDARTITVTPWEKSMVQAIEKAIMKSDLGLNPNTAGTVIRVPMPPLTEERRRDLTKVVRHAGEECKVAVRNLRREANEQLKKLLKEKAVSEDDERRAQDEVQRLTDRVVAEVDRLVQSKEGEILAV